MICYFDSLSLNKNAGGVKQFSDALEKGLRGEWKDGVSFVSKDYPWLYKKIGGVCGRFVFDSICSVFQNNNNCIFPNYFLPYGLSSATAKKSAVVVHDLQYKYYPEFFSKKKVAWLDLAMTRVHNNAGAVVCISEATKNDYIKFFGSRSNVEVIYNPIDVSEPSVNGIGGGQRYVLTSANFYPHKNFGGVLKLFCQLKKLGYFGKLIITGGGKEKVSREIEKVDDDVRADVVHLGFVNEEYLRTLQFGADALISLSKFEGFNLPAAECAALGTRLILSDIPVHREIFDQAFFFNENCGQENLVLEFLKIGAVEKWKFLDCCRPGYAARRYIDLLNGL